jgi:hypothetical protein
MIHSQPDPYQRARDENLDDVRRAGNGVRNETLNRAAYATAQLSAAARFDEAAEKHALLAAAKSAGLGEVEAKTTINSAWKSGVAQPRRFDRAGREPTPFRKHREPGTSYFEYIDADGVLACRKVRIDKADGEKDFRWQHPDGKGGWLSGRGGPAIPYRLPDLLKAPADAIVYIAEGERKADKLASWGLVATSSKDLPDDLSVFAGRTIAILPDNDEKGVEIAEKLLQALDGVAAKGALVELPGLPHQGDIMEWGGTREDLESLVNASMSSRSGKSEPEALEYIWANDIQPQLVGFWLIKKLLPAQGLALLYGHPGSGKTFLALDFAFHVAMGWDWQGRKVNQGLVVYVAAEGARGLQNRVAAFKIHHGVGSADPFPLIIIPSPIDMQAHDADTQRLASTIQKACKESGCEPALVIIDTISKTFGGGKENTDDMVTYVANCSRIATEFDCCVMPVHHRPKDAESDDPRGHSSLRGGSDTVIICEAGKPKKARVKKQKDGEEGETFLFDLVPVELGVDEDGDPVTSCYVQPALADFNTVVDPRQKALSKLNDQQRLALHWLGEAIASDGHAVPNAIPDNLINRTSVSKVVSLEAWRQLWLSANRTGVGQVASDEAGQVSDRRSDTLSRTFLRYRDRLLSLGIIGVWEDFAWIAWGKLPGNRTAVGQVSDILNSTVGQVGHPLLEEGVPVRLAAKEKPKVIFPATDDDSDLDAEPYRSGGWG